jgi:hypothetical protein
MQDQPKPDENDDGEDPATRPLPPIAVHGCGIFRPWDLF